MQEFKIYSRQTLEKNGCQLKHDWEKFGIDNYSKGLRSRDSTQVQG